MNVYKLFPSRWLSAVDLDGKEYTLTMKSLVIENVGQPPKNEDKPILSFRKTEKALVLNKTNAMIIASLYGPETDTWMGKPITLYATQVRTFGAIHDAIRVRDGNYVSAAPDPITDADDDMVDPDPIATPPPQDDTDTPFVDEIAVIIPPTSSRKGTLHMPTQNGTQPQEEEAPTDPHKWLLAELSSTFPKEIRDDARHWLVGRFTTKTTPDHPRTSETELTDDERRQLATALRQHREVYRKDYAVHLSQEAAE